MDSDREIKYLIRASYPIIYVQSWEEERVINALKKIVKEIPEDIERERAEMAVVKRLDETTEKYSADDTSHRPIKKIVQWSITEGMLGHKTGSSKDVQDPLRALEFIHDFRGEEAIFVLKDFHHYLQDPAVVRKLRDLAHLIIESGKTLILLSPVLKIPSELEKDVAVVDYSLPTVEDMDAILEEVIHTVDEDKVDLSNVDAESAEREKIKEAALGLTANEAKNVFSKSFVQERRLDIDVILSEKEQIIRKSGVLEFYNARERFSDIGGLGQLKDWLSKRKRAFSGEAREFGLPQPRGILLIGVPGCGKSLTAKAVGALWKQPLLRFDVGKVFAGLVGSSEENMRKAVRTAEAVAPSVLWLDELEKGLSGTQSSSFSDAGTTARVFGSFVTWLQEKTSPVFVIATANDINMLPPELLRKGRFDEIFFVDLPSRDEREEIFRIHVQKRGRDPEKFDISGLSMASEGFSGSEIEQVVISALYDAFDMGRDLESVDIYNSLQETVPLSQTMEEKIASLREWARTRARWASEEVIGKETVEGRQLDL
jgi:SpoVK/Ycf46/Vps4 family AAA+-type ATPase